jgi:hypothetical protein
MGGGRKGEGGEAEGKLRHLKWRAKYREIGRALDFTGSGPGGKRFTSRLSGEKDRRI